MKTKNSFSNTLISLNLFRRRTLSLAVCAALCPTVSLGQPTGQEVIGGNVKFDNSISGQMTITNSQNAMINWQNFNIAQNEIVRFIQENGQSAVLNRVIGGDPSEILGQLYSNGKVFLINPNGIVFGARAQIDTQGLIASSLNLSDDDFKKGNFHFIAGSKAGGVVNEGIIHANDDGNIVLIAPNIENKGTIKTDGGQITLAAGQEMIMTSLDNPEMRFKIQAREDRVLNFGELIANGGAINVFADSIKQNGVMNAGRFVADANDVQIDKQGHIRLIAKQDVTLSEKSATLADSNAGKGGKIDISADKVAILNESKISASGEKGGGEIRIGGDYQGKKSDIPNAKNVLADKNSQILADAKTAGQGGKVILWADEKTAAHGKISAKGGKNSGDGGFVETSGHKLDTSGVNVNASAPKGKNGQWLLDPDDVVITDDPASTTATSKTMVADVENALNNGTDVLVEASGAGITGNVTVETSVAKTDTAAVNNPTLKLKATNAIILNPDVSIDASASSNKLNVILNADSDGANGGNIQLNGGSAIKSNGGNIVLGGGDCSSGTSCTQPAKGYGLDTNQIEGVTLTNANIDSKGGAISLQGEGFSDPTATNAHGVFLNESKITSVGGNGAINITGTGGTGDSGNNGIFITGYSGYGIEPTNRPSEISGGGIVTLSGTGKSATTEGQANYGISTDTVNISSNATPASGAAVNLTGIGANADAGLLFEGNTAVSTQAALSSNNGAGNTTPVYSNLLPNSATPSVSIYTPPVPPPPVEPPPPPPPVVEPTPTSVDTVTGATGNDTITSGSGNDTVTGATGNDTITSGSGNDTVTGATGNDTVTGNTNTDVVNTPAVENILTSVPPQTVQTITNIISTSSPEEAKALVTFFTESKPETVQAIGELIKQNSTESVAEIFEEIKTSTPEQAKAIDTFFTQSEPETLEEVTQLVQINSSAAKAIFDEIKNSTPEKVAQVVSSIKQESVGAKNTILMTLSSVTPSNATTNSSSPVTKTEPDKKSTTLSGVTTSTTSETTQKPLGQCQ